MKYKILFLSCLLAGIFLTGCDKNFVSINTDPEHLTSANMNYKYLFTAAELITSGNSDANAYEDWRNNLIYASTMIQHLSSTVGYWGGDKYTYNSGYNSAYWEQNYGDPVKNIVEVVTNTKDKPDLVNLYNIARIFKVFMFQRITDMYGDCPYSEAGLGYISGITTPKYDKQQDIYTDMLNELSDAAAKLDPSATNTLGSGDLLYGADPVAWKKFAYSEMLRLAMRMSKVDAVNAEKWAAAAVAGGVMASNDDNAIFSHASAVPGTVTVYGNGLVLDGVDPTAARVSETLVDKLVNTADPRLSYLATVIGDASNTDDLGNNAPGIQIGQPNGYDNLGKTTDISTAPNYPGSQDNYSVVNRQTFSRMDAPTFFLTYAETAFLEAEAVVRGWITGDAATFYNAGVTAAMGQFDQIAANVTGTPAPLAGISSSAVTAYLATNPYNAGDAMNQINTQYWLSTFMDEYEAWANWRRSGYPVLVPVANYPLNATNGTIPRRFTYSQGEASTNPTNYQDAVSRLGDGDKMTSRIWWDVAQ